MVNETTAVSDHYPVYAEFWRDRDADLHHKNKIMRDSEVI